MDGSNPTDRPISSRNSPIAGTSKVEDTMATYWTDEKHKSYINSMEASFVKQLYSREYGSNDLLGWFSRTQIPTNSSASDFKNHSSAQFKVLRRGCWGELNFDRATSQTENENESQRISENPWIKHFRSHPSIEHEHLKSEDLLDNGSLGDRSVQSRHEREETSSNQQPPSCSHKLLQVSVGSITEVSDQNFEDMEVEREEPSRRSCKKRARGAGSPIKDQVVPFMVPVHDEKTAHFKENSTRMQQSDSMIEGGWYKSE